MMESNRQQKINRLIQKELSEIFLLETKKMHGVFISVTNVRVSPDLGIAHAYLSIFPSENPRHTSSGSVPSEMRRSSRSITCLAASLTRGCGSYLNGFVKGWFKS